MVPRLRTQYLLIFTLAAVVPASALGIVQFSLLQRSQPVREAKAIQEHLRVADLLAANLRLQAEQDMASKSQIASRSGPLLSIQAQLKLAATPTRRVLVVDQSGHILAQSPGPNLRADLELPPVRAVVDGRRGSLRFSAVLDGEKPTQQLASFTPVAGTGWGVVVMSPAQELLGVDPWASLPGLGMGLSLTVLASLGFAYWLSERISQPLGQLSEKMQQMALGDRAEAEETLASAPALELQVLSDSFGAMKERIRSEAEANRRLYAGLAAEKRKLELVIEAIVEGVLVYDLTGWITTANPALWKMLGREPGSVERWQNLPLQNSRGELVGAEASALARPVALGEAAGAFYRLEGTAGRRILQLSASPLRNSKGEILGGVAVIRDVTAQKESERLRDDFVATLTHDLRTPLLAAVQTLGFTLEGQYGPLTDAQQQLLLAVVESHRELLGLVESLLTIYRYEAGRMRLRPEPTDLVALATAAIEELRPLAEARHQHLVLDAPMAVEVPCDRQQVRRVIINLIDNALKFTPTSGTVRVRVGSVGRVAQLAVCDSGRGIAPEKQANLFLRFAQADSSGTGTGLGLYLCRQVVEAHGGKIWVESEPGCGSTFTFSLPVEPVAVSPGPPRT